MEKEQIRVLVENVARETVQALVKNSKQLSYLGMQRRGLGRPVGK